MSTFSWDFGDYDLPDRNKLAVKTIENYVKLHAAADVAIGLAGFLLPVPGAGFMALLASLVAQVPIYQSLAKDLGTIYEAPHDAVVQAIVNEGVLTGSVGMATATAGMATIDLLVGEFGIEFVQDICLELFGELGLGFAASLVPYLGGVVAAALDVAIAATVTWRAGTMVAIYYQSGGWVDGSRKKTYERAKKMTGSLSPVIYSRVKLDNIPREIREALVHIAAQLVRYAQRLRDAGVGDDGIRKALSKEGVIEEVIDEVIRRLKK